MYYSRTKTNKTPKLQLGEKLPYSVLQILSLDFAVQGQVDSVFPPREAAMGSMTSCAPTFTYLSFQMSARFEKKSNNLNTANRSYFCLHTKAGRLKKTKINKTKATCR